jgi:hypothetical protein
VRILLQTTHRPGSLDKSPHPREQMFKPIVRRGHVAKPKLGVQVSSPYGPATLYNNFKCLWEAGRTTRPPKKLTFVGRGRGVNPP